MDIDRIERFVSLSAEEKRRAMYIRMKQAKILCRGGYAEGRKALEETVELLVNHFGLTTIEAGIYIGIEWADADKPGCPPDAFLDQFLNSVENGKDGNESTSVS